MVRNGIIRGCLFLHTGGFKSALALHEAGKKIAPEKCFQLDVCYFQRRDGWRCRYRSTARRSLSRVRSENLACNIRAPSSYVRHELMRQDSESSRSRLGSVSLGRPRRRCALSRLLCGKPGEVLHASANSTRVFGARSHNVRLRWSATWISRWRRVRSVRSSPAVRPTCLRILSQAS